MAIATETEACREYARNVGRERPDLAWICTDYDTWEPNPFYAGPPVRHPEDDRDDEEQYQSDAADGCGFDYSTLVSDAGEFDPGADYDNEIPF